jgi:hypothetical protein
LAETASPSTPAAHSSWPRRSRYSARTVSIAGHASYVFREIGPSAIGARASRATAAHNARPEIPSSTSTSATKTIVAAPQSIISVLNAAL